MATNKMLTTLDERAQLDKQITDTFAVAQSALIHEAAAGADLRPPVAHPTNPLAPILGPCARCGSRAASPDIVATLGQNICEPCLTRGFQDAVRR
jgi:hypothetical protein